MTAFRDQVVAALQGDVCAETPPDGVDAIYRDALGFLVFIRVLDVALTDDVLMAAVALVYEASYIPEFVSEPRYGVICTRDLYVPNAATQEELYLHGIYLATFSDQRLVIDYRGDDPEFP